MSGRAVLAAVVGLLAAAPASADEAIARRLAALRSLVDPGAARAPAGPVARGCPDAAWWRITPYAERARTDRAIRDASLRFRVDPGLIRSVIRIESAFDPDALSHRGAMGLMQLMPATAEELGVVCPFDPRENVIGGTRYLRQLRDRLGSWSRALAGYHAGPRRVETGRIPRVTRRYVRDVLRLWQPEREAEPGLG